MSISLGSSTISNIYLGSSTVSAAYLGSTQVFGGTSGSNNPVTSGRVLELNNTAASYGGSGTTWSDVSGHGFNFTLVNSPTFSTTDGFTFDGSTQYALLQSGSGLQNYFTGSVRGGITVFVDVSGSTSTANDWSLISGWRDQGSVYKWLFEINTNNTVESAVKTTPTGVTGNNTIDTITRAQRNILSFVVDSDVNGTKVVYVGNNSQLTGTQGVPNENWASDDPPFTIAARINSSNNPFQYLNGKIKSVVVYNRTLSAGERTDVYNYLVAL